MDPPGSHRARAKPAARRTDGHHATGRHLPTRTRHSGEPTYSFVRLEVDLGHEVIARPSLPFLGEIRAFLKERELEEEESLLDLEAALLHALQALGFSHVDHWEVDPGGWLPLPEAVHPGLIEPVGHLLKALASDRWQEIARAHGFSVRLSGDGERRVDAVLRRRHREREHSLSLDLRGRWPSYDVHRAVNALRERLPVLRAQVTASTIA